MFSLRLFSHPLVWILLAAYLAVAFAACHETLLENERKQLPFDLWLAAGLASCFIWPVMVVFALTSLALQRLVFRIRTVRL